MKSDTPSQPGFGQAVSGREGHRGVKQENGTRIRGGSQVSKTVQETLQRFQEGPPSDKTFDDLPSWEQLEHLEYMETASARA